MTISSDICKATYTTASAVTNYAYNFKIFHAAQISVTVVDADTLNRENLILALDYGVSGVGEESGGAVHLTASGQAKAGTGNKLVILRNMEFTQETDYRPHDVFPAETHERALDILTMMCQELREILGRAIVRNPDEDETIPYHEIVEVVENMEAYRDQAAASAEASAKSAGESKQAATEAKTARTQAQTAQGKAEAARDEAEALRDQTQEYADEGKGYRDQAETYADNANKSAGEAGTFKDQARAAADEAGNYAADSLAYRKQAQDAAGESANYRDQSRGFAEDSALSATAAQQAQAEAERAQRQSEAAAGQALNSAKAAKDSETAAKAAEENAAGSAAAAKDSADMTAETAARFEADLDDINGRLDQNETDISQNTNRLDLAEAKHDDDLAFLLFTDAIDAAQNLISATTLGIQAYYDELALAALEVRHDEDITAVESIIMATAGDLSTKIDNDVAALESDHDDDISHLLFAAAITAAQGLASTTRNGLELYKLGGYQ